MRLINTTTFKLRDSFTDRPEYAILSHTWQKEGEITLRELEQNLGQSREKEKAGWNKIRRVCEIARDADHNWVWIDTCCIDKTSTAELSEAINSMYRWYGNAARCYVYLSDVTGYKHSTGFVGTFVDKPVWFTRGWTLQELIAPSDIIFLSQTWSILGTKVSLRRDLASITGIDIKVLEKPKSLFDASIAQRMCWASDRETTRDEDIAYCLMGIFDVNMPLLYGEGSRKAFVRLQEEIIRDSEDESLFAWQHPRSWDGNRIANLAENEGMFATHPCMFQGSSSFAPDRRIRAPYKTTNRGLAIEMPITTATEHAQGEPSSLIGILSCHDEKKWGYSIAVQLESSVDRYYRKKRSDLILVAHATVESAKCEKVYIHKWGKRSQRRSLSRCCYVRHVHAGISFSGGLMIEATALPPSHDNASASGWRLSDQYLQWKTDCTSQSLPSFNDSCFVALNFQLEAHLRRNWDLSSLCVVLRATHNECQVSSILPAKRKDCEAPDFLFERIKDYAKMPVSTTNCLKIQGGLLRVKLNREIHQDRQAYALYLDHHSFDIAIADDLAYGRTENVRLIEADFTEKRRLQ